MGQRSGCAASLALLAVHVMSGEAGPPRARVLHTGAGVARREAYHERRAQERAQLDESVDVQACLRAERSGDVSGLNGFAPRRCAAF